jgi:hypothetical protein
MPPYTSRSPIYSTLSTVTVLFKTPDLSGSYQGWNPVMPPDAFYNGFQLCFKTGSNTWCDSIVQRVMVLSVVNPKVDTESKN